MAKAPAKSINGNASNLNTIIALHTEINELNTHLKGKKVELKEASDTLSAESRSVFNIDLGAVGSGAAPEVFGNHEYTVDGRVITVNYKMAAGGLSFSQIGGRSAREVLTELIDEKEYKKCFTEEHSINDDDEKLSEVHSYRPDLVGLRMGKLPDEAIKELQEKYPDSFSPYIIDEDAYVKEIDSAEVSTEVFTGAGFIEKVSKLSDDSKSKLGDFIRAVLGKKAVSAVKVGNKVS
jgi:hypothetical protein